MELEQRNKIYQKAIHTYGDKSQMLMLCEELSELSVEVLKTVNRDQHNRARMIDELADVRVMIEQIELMLQCNVEVKIAMASKLARLSNRIELFKAKKEI